MLESLCVVKGFIAMATQVINSRLLVWGRFLESLVPKEIPGPAFQLREQGGARVRGREARKILTSITPFTLQFSFLGTLKVHTMVLTVRKAPETMNVTFSKGSMLKDCTFPWIAGVPSASQACCSQIYQSASHFLKTIK